MHHVFVSYSRRDAGPVLAAVRAMRADGIPVWIDQRDIEASVPWMDEITLAIDGAGVVVVFESAAWHESAACAAELAAAIARGVRVIYYDAYSAPIAIVVAEVGRYLNSRNIDDHARTELLVRSSIWERQGRQKAQLVGGRTLLRYRRLAGIPAPPPADARNFVSASQRHQRRKRTLRVVGAVVAGLLVLGGVVSYVVFDFLDDQLAQTAAEFDGAETARGADALNPYLHLDRLSHFAAEWSNPQWESSAIALMPVLPSERWASESSDGRDLFESASPSSDTSPDGRHMVRAGSGNAIDIVDSASGGLYRTLRPAQRASGIAWRPDGTWLAVGSGRDIELLDVEYGIASRLLTGGAGTVTEVRWSADGATIVARTASDLTLAWDVSVAKTAVSFPGDKFSDLVRMPDTGELAALTRAGAVVLLDPDSLAELDRIDLGDGDLAGKLIVSVDGQHLAFLSIGADLEAVTYDLVEQTSKRIPMVDCDSYDLTFGDDRGESLLVACLSGIMSVDIGSGATAMHAAGGEYVAIARHGDVVYAATYSGILQRFSGSLDTPEDLGDEFLRPMSVTRIVVSDDGSRLYHGGTGANSSLRSNRLLHLDADPVESYALIFAGQPVGDTRAVAVSADGDVVAHGFDDGSVWVRKPNDGWVVQRLQPFAGAVRGAVFTDDDTLAVVGQDGVAALLDVASARDTVTQRRERLAAAVERGEELGLYRNALPPELQPGN